MPIPEKAKPIDSELTSRLGQIVTRWSVLENWLSHMLASVVGAEAAPMSIITANVSTNTIIQWMRTTLNVHVHKQPELQEVLDLLTRADELRGDRNALVHGVWTDDGCEPGTCLVNTVRWDRNEIIRDWLVTTADLDELLGHIDDWIADFMTTGLKFGFPRRKGETKSIFAD